MNDSNSKIDGKRYWVSITVFDNERKALEKVSCFTDHEIVQWLYTEMAKSLGKLIRMEDSQRQWNIERSEYGKGTNSR